MNAKPEQAKAILDSIGSPTRQVKSVKARYSLLYSQALDKCYIDLTSDSLIRPAVSYYSHHGPDKYKFMSLYYLGRVYYNANDYTQALVCFTKAEDLSGNIDDQLMKGLLFLNIGKVFRKQLDYPQALVYYRKAYELYGSDNIVHQNDALFNIALTFFQMNDYDSSRCAFVKVMDVAQRLSDSLSIRSSIKYMIAIDVFQRKYDDAFAKYLVLKANNSKYDADKSLLGYLSEIYAYKGDFAKSKHFLSKAWSDANNRSDSINLFFISSYNNCFFNNYKQAYEDLSKGGMLQDSLIRATLQQPVVTAQRDLYAQQLEMEKHKQKEGRIITSLVFSLLVLSIIIIVLVAVHIAKGKEDKLVKYDDMVKELQKDCAFQRELVEQKEEALTERVVAEFEQFKALFIDKFKIVNSFSRVFCNVGSDEPLTQKYIYADVKKQIELIKTSKYSAELEDAVNRYCEDSIKKYLQDFIKVSDKDRRQLCYQAAGFSLNVISYFLDEHSSATYKRKKRIYDRILSSNSPNKGLYIKYFNL